MSGSGFINAMQWWNDELQTSHLKKIEQSLNSNLSSLRWAQQQDYLDQQDLQQRIEASKNSIFAARKLIDEAEEQLSNNEPNNALFLFVKTMEVMHQLDDTDFSDLSDKEYFFKVDKKYKRVGEQLEEVFDEQYIYHLKHLKDTRHLCLILINIQFFKEVIEVCESAEKNFLGNTKVKKLKEDVIAHGQEKNRLELAEIICSVLDKKGYGKLIPYIKDQIDGRIEQACRIDAYGLVNAQMLNATHPSNMNIFIDPLYLISKELQEKGNEYLGIKFNSFDEYVYD